MKRFIFQVACFVALQGLIAGVLLSFYRGNSDHYLCATIDKHDLIARQPSPRIVFVGGSNLTLGLDCAVVKERLPAYHPINMSLHAALGLEFMLAEIADTMRPGDVIILSLEYEHFLKDQSSDVLFRVIQMRPASIKYIPFRQFADNALAYLGAVLQYAFRSMIGEKWKNPPPFSRGSFNEFGDVVAHRHMKCWNFPTSRLGEEGSIPTQLSATVNRLNAFDDLCRRRGVRVFLSWPPLATDSFAKSEKVLREIEAEVNRRLKIPVLGRPDEMRFPRDHFYDSKYHLNDTGIRRRTELLTHHLCEQLSR